MFAFVKDTIKDLNLDFGGSTQKRANCSGFVIVGAGLPRTGTLSIQSALSHLLDGPCYHMHDVCSNDQVDLSFWHKAMDGEVRRKEWVQFLQHRGYRAGVDFPVALFYKEILNAFPEAKVILTTRDPNDWYHSVKNSILKMKFLLQDPVCQLFVWLIGRRKMADTISRAADFRRPGFRKGMFETIESGENEAVAYYQRWVDDVLQTVPKDKLLIFDVRQGWEPLCQFLDMPVPSQPFPQLNDTRSIQRLLMTHRILSYIFVFGLSLIIFLLLWHCLFSF